MNFRASTGSVTLTLNGISRPESEPTHWAQISNITEPSTVVGSLLVLDSSIRADHACRECRGNLGEYQRWNVLAAMDIPKIGLLEVPTTSVPVP